MTGIRKGGMLINSKNLDDLIIWNTSINLKFDNAVSILILDGLSIDDDNAALIAEGLKENKYLQELSMAANPKSFKHNIGPPGIRALGEALKVNKTLKSLNLSGSNMRYQGAQILFHSLEDNRSLTKLKLKNCSLGNSAAEEIINCLKKNWTLTKIVLLSEERVHAQNTIGHEESLRIKKLLDRNKKISEIVFFSLGSMDEKSAVFLLYGDLRKNILRLVALIFTHEYERP
jgi:hypothetical protein